MTLNDLHIRPASVSDARDISELYAYYVKNTAVTFEYETPTAQEFEARIAHTLEKYPYFIAEQNGSAVGYVYASELGTRAAYSRSAVLSIYVSHECRKSGVGSALYYALERALKAQGVLNLYASISYCDRQDEYLTRDSILFHEKMGFSEVGHYNSCGYKFDRFYDVVWMEKHIGAHSSCAPRFKRFCEIEPDFLL